MYSIHVFASTISRNIIQPAELSTDIILIWKVDKVQNLKLQISLIH